MDKSERDRLRALYGEPVVVCPGCDGEGYLEALEGGCRKPCPACAGDGEPHVAMAQRLTLIRAFDALDAVETELARERRVSEWLVDLLIDAEICPPGADCQNANPPQKGCLACFRGRAEAEVDAEAEADKEEPRSSKEDGNG